MLKNCREEDFYQIKLAAMTRLGPGNISGFLWGGLVLSTLMTILAFAQFADEVGVSVIIARMMAISILLLLVQIVFTILFTFKKVAYTFQKLLSIFVSFVGFKISIDTYQVFFTLSEKNYLPSFINIIGIILLVGGVILLILSTIRAVNRVKKGELGKEGRGLYDFKNSKGTVSIPIIFGFTMLAGAAGRLISETSTDLTIIIFLFFAVLLQYSIALALPEFFLVVYCKFRFESFKV
jgi:hypothetical protein